MSEIKRIVDELKRIHNGETWHGPSLKSSLAGITAEQAAAHPLAGAHSIWEIVRHIAGWEKVILRRLEGHKMTEPEEGDFPESSNTGISEWSQVIAELDLTHEQLIKGVSGLS